MDHHYTPFAAFPSAETHAMRLALDAARRGRRGANPLVGAVVLAEDGTVIGTGYHRGAGTAHAEVDALANVARGRHSDVETGDGQYDLSRCTMVVTLEPCNHYGRTAPCSAAILDSGIRRLVYAAPDRTAAAGGAAMLATAGIDVAGGLLEADSRELNRRWFAAVEGNRPFVTLKIAQTVDGRIAAADGTSQWITGAEARADSHGLRGRADAVLVGTGTVLADNPRLTARDSDGVPTAVQPLRVVMGKRGIPDDAAVRTGPGGFLHCRTRSPHEVLTTLYGRGVRHLMIEGGAGVSTAFLAAGLVDELYVYTAPMMLGSGTPAIGDLGVPTLDAGARWRWDPSGGGIAVVVGPDLRLHAEPLSETIKTTD